MRNILLGSSTAAAACLLACNLTQAQTKIAAVPLEPYGVMTQGELNVEHPVPHPPPEHEGYIESGPDGGIAWRGVGKPVIDGTGRIHVALPIWAGEYAPKNPLRGEGDKLRLLTLSPAGKVERTVDYPSASLDRIDLLVAGDGAVMVVAGDKLMRIGEDGRPAAQIDLPGDQKQFEPWYLTSSASGKTLRLKVNDKHALLIDTATLKVLKTCEESNEIEDSGEMTDTLEFETRVEETEPKVVQGLERKQFCQKRERLNEFGGVDFNPLPIDDNRILALSQHYISLRGVDRSEVWKTAAPTEMTFESRDAQLSRNGNRLAVRVMREVEHHEPDSLSPMDQRNGTWRKVRKMDVEDSIAILDVSSGKIVSLVPLLGHTTPRYFDPEAQFALSPDGGMLAVIEDGALTLWKMD